jgi:hypothetical protein
LLDLELAGGQHAANADQADQQHEHRDQHFEQAEPAAATRGTDGAIDALTGLLGGSGRRRGIDGVLLDKPAVAPGGMEMAGGVGSHHLPPVLWPVWLKARESLMNVELLGAVRLRAFSVVLTRPVW